MHMVTNKKIIKRPEELCHLRFTKKERTRRKSYDLQKRENYKSYGSAAIIFLYLLLSRSNMFVNLTTLVNHIIGHNSLCKFFLIDKK